MADKTIAIRASTINGAIQEFPPTYYFPCSQVIPQGESIIRDYDTNDCIVAKKVFLVKYGQNIFGTTQFESMVEFLLYKESYCASCCISCVIKVGNCVLLYNGCSLTYNKNIISN